MAGRDALPERLHDVCRAHLVPGAQLGLLRRGERNVLCEGVTAHDGDEPVERGTRFHAGSIAKALTALVVLDADARGELDVGLPCDQQSSASWDDTPLALMSQTTGRPNELPDLEEDLGDFVARVAAMPLLHEPGRFSYCNAGWSVLDLLLRERVGASFEELARDRVLGPDARFGQPEGSAAGHAVSAGGEVVSVPSVYADAAAAAGSRWWASADELLDFAELHLRLGDGRFEPGLVERMRQPLAPVPGATISDAWGLGWAVWRRAEHRAFGWAGFTGGHRAYLRCFPEQQAAVVVLANTAGGLFGPPGGSALFDELLPDLLDATGVPAPPGPTYATQRGSTQALSGAYGPFEVTADGEDALVLQAAAVGEREPVRLTRSGGDTFEVAGCPPGATPVAFSGSLLYLGPFAFPRNG